MTPRLRLFAAPIALLFVFAASPARAFVVEFELANFTTTPIFNDVTAFSFSIDIGGPLAPGVYDQTDITSISYNLFGVLADPAGTPSGFPAFNLVRNNVTGAEFISQGSSLQFEIGAGADLSDGLQFSELVGIDPVFVLNAREVGTGRYHPPLLELRSDGTGRLQNSNNFGGTNPGNGMMVDVTFGEEYIVDLGFSTGLTIATPEPSTSLTLGAVLFGGLLFRRRKRSVQRHL